MLYVDLRANVQKKHFTGNDKKEFYEINKSLEMVPQ